MNFRIFPTNFSPEMSAKKHRPAAKVLYDCSVDKRHKLTHKQAASNAWNCSHCGAELKAKRNKVIELQKLADNLGYKIEKKQ